MLLFHTSFHFYLMRLSLEQLVALACIFWCPERNIISILELPEAFPHVFLMNRVIRGGKLLAKCLPHTYDINNWPACMAWYMWALLSPTNENMLSDPLKQIKTDSFVPFVFWFFQKYGFAVSLGSPRMTASVFPCKESDIIWTVKVTLLCVLILVFHPTCCFSLPQPSTVDKKCLWTNKSPLPCINWRANTKEFNIRIVQYPINDIESFTHFDMLPNLWLIWAYILSRRRLVESKHERQHIYTKSYDKVGGGWPGPS